MISSQNVSQSERQRSRIRNFPMTNHEDIKTFVDPDMIVENEHRGYVPSSQEQIGCISAPSSTDIVDVTIRREGGRTETYLWNSMTKKAQRRTLQGIQEFMLGHRQRTRCNDHFSRQARKCRQEGSQFDGNTDAMVEDPRRRLSCSNDSSILYHAKSNRAVGISDSTQSSKRKRGRKRSVESRTISEAFHDWNCTLGPNRVILYIRDEKAVMAFYRRVFMDSQQTLCRYISKWWIRAINPNKQTNYPYAGGPEKKPPWWPETPPNNAKGTEANGLVRHREPDHLIKAERLTLLPHILNKVTDPCNRADVNGIDVTKLQQITIDSINNENKEKLKHDSWRELIKELFRVAKLQERYKCSEIDDTAQTHVLDSYSIWQYKHANTEADEKLESEREDGNDEDNSGELQTIEDASEQKSNSHDHVKPQSLDIDIKPHYLSYVSDTHLPVNLRHETDNQLSYQHTENNSRQMPNLQAYDASIAQVPRSYHSPYLMLQEPLRHQSDISDRLSSYDSFGDFLQSTTGAHTTIPQFQTIQPIFPPPAISNCANAVSRPLTSMPMARLGNGPPHFPTFYDAGLFPRSNITFQASGRDLASRHHRHLLQFSQQ